ncbi:MAG: hypothetical protein D6805_10470, partial [Planctomycetota bacterium]
WWGGEEVRAGRVVCIFPSLWELAVVVRGASLVVGPDTGVLHLAALCRTPSVGIFGPTDSRRFFPWGWRSVCVQLPLGCSGCHRRICPLAHHRCMRDLEVEEVWRACYRLLEGGEKGTAVG